MQAFLTQLKTDWLPYVDRIIDSLGAAGLVELVCVLVLPLLAMLLRMQVMRWINRNDGEGLRADIIEFIAMMSGPLFALLFVLLAQVGFHVADHPVFVLPLLLKICFAWLAIRGVMLLSSRQGAGWVIALVIIPITLLHLFDLYDPAVETLSDIQFSVGKAKFTAYGVLKSIIAVIALFWIAGLVVDATDNRMRRVRSLHVSNRVLIMKFFQIFLYFVAFMIGLQVLGVDLTALSVVGGALGVGIGFGLQKIASNFISGIILLFEKSVQVDDLIELADGTRGFIRQTAARYTRLEIADGREMFIPNEEFISQRVTTLTHSTRRSRITVQVGVAYGSNVDLVHDTLIEAAKSAPRCLEDPAPLAFLTTFADSSINFDLHFWLDDVTEGAAGPKHEVMKAILRLFTERGIDIPFPHQVQIGDPAMTERVAELEAELEKARAAAKAKPPAKPQASRKKPA
jgi:small-conductance mechanosensitive channel